MIWIQPCHFISCNLMQSLFLLFCSLHLYFLSICLVFRFVYAAPLSLFCFCASLLLIHFAYLSGISALFTWSALAPLVFITVSLLIFVFCHVYLVFCHHTCYYSDIFSAFSHYHDSGLPQSRIFRDVITLNLLLRYL